MAVAGPREHAVIDWLQYFTKRGRRRELSQENHIQMSDRRGKKKTRQVQGEHLVTCNLKIKT